MVTFNSSRNTPIRWPTVAALLLTFCLNLFIPRAGFAWDAKLTLKLKQNEIEMGRSFLGQLIYDGKSDTGPADLTPWEKNFVVKRYYFSSQRNAGRTHSTENVRLYPRHSGALVINPIAHGGTRMDPVKVRVNPLTRNGVTGDPLPGPLPHRVQVGAPLEVAVEMPLLSATNSVAADPWEIPGARVIPLPQKRIMRKNHASILLRWKIYALHPGDYPLDLPTLSQRGNGIWRFHLPLQQIEVFPLPSYLPPTLPIGQLTLNSRLIKRDSHPYWRIDIANSGLLPDDLYGLNRALVNATGVDEGAIRVTPSTSTPSGGERRSYRVPVPQWTLDIWHGPRITQKYYDPETASVVTLRHRLPPSWRLPLWANGVIILLAILCGLALLIGLYKTTAYLRKQWNFRRKILQCNDPTSLRRLLLAQHGQKTLEAWAGAFQSPTATVIADDLNRLCFTRSSLSDQPCSTASTDLDRLKKSAVKLHSRSMIRPFFPGKKWQRVLLS